MTKQSDILNDSKYVQVLDHGFVGLVDHMGSDAAIVSAARVSYGDGTKTVNEDRGLIRYLIRHKHTSPIEMCEVKLHLKMPIFVMRQWVRHRTASLNEYSGRYSIMSDEMYMPALDAIQPQSKVNKQGRDGTFTETEKEGIQWMLNAAYEHSYEIYKGLIESSEETKDPRAVIYDPYGEDGWFEDGYPGLARELARVALPLGNYTELYWKQDLHNILHLIKLRRDSHAQAEIRAYAEAVYQLIKPLFPFAVEAWEDYVWEAKSMSRMEIALMQDLISNPNPVAIVLADKIAAAGGEKEFALSIGMSLREFREFKANWNF